MKPIRVALLTVALLPLAALAGPPDAAQTEADQEAEKRLRMARVLGLAEDLELDSAQALKMDETMRKFDERRRPLKEQVRESAEILERAADGDSSAMSQVEQAAQRAFDARAQLASLDREMFQALSKDLPPQRSSSTRCARRCSTRWTRRCAGSGSSTTAAECGTSLDSA
jgi:hypothetical protein